MIQRFNGSSNPMCKTTFPMTIHCQNMHLRESRLDKVIGGPRATASRRLRQAALDPSAEVIDFHPSPARSDEHPPWPAGACPGARTGACSQLPCFCQPPSWPLPPGGHTHPEHPPSAHSPPVLQCTVAVLCAMLAQQWWLCLKESHTNEHLNNQCACITCQLLSFGTL